jgi:hypothetical protein
MCDTNKKETGKMSGYRELVPTKTSHILVLRKCGKGLISHNGFQWNEGAPTVAPDWNNEPVCGGGLHGLPWGEGSAGLLDGSVWMCVLVDAENGYLCDEGDLTDKCKFRRAEDASVGTKEEVIANIVKYAPKDARTNFATQKAGYMATQTAGDGATQKAGDGATQKAGDGATQKAGYMATQTAGGGATQKAVYGATQTAGDGATQTAGYGATQKAGYMATQTAGDGATQKAGYGSVQITRWFEAGEIKTACRIVGEAEANKWYYVERGVWTLCDEEKSKELDEKANV